MKLVLTIDALRDLSKLPRSTARRITEKMKWYARQDDPLRFAKPLKNIRTGKYRFRVGDYRVLADVQHGIISILYILAVRHRKEAYRL